MERFFSHVRNCAIGEYYEGFMPILERPIVIKKPWNILKIKSLPERR